MKVKIHLAPDALSSDILREYLDSFPSQICKREFVA